VRNQKPKKAIRRAVFKDEDNTWTSQDLCSYHLKKAKKDPTFRYTNSVLSLSGQVECDWCSAELEDMKS